jgi:hypothetical protein
MKKWEDEAGVHPLMNEDLVTPSNVVELQLLLAAKYNIRI